jgi:hypothetical protein
MVGKVPFEHLQPVINLPDQTGVPCQQVKPSQSTTVDCTHPVGHLVMDILRPEHRARLRRILSALKPFVQFLFPFAKNSAILGFHSKLLSFGLALFADNAFYPIKTGVSSFLMAKCQSNHA